MGYLIGDEGSNRVLGKEGGRVNGVDVLYNRGRGVKSVPGVSDG